MEPKLMQIVNGGTEPDDFSHRWRACFKAVWGLSLIHI